MGEHCPPEHMPRQAERVKTHSNHYLALGKGLPRGLLRSELRHTGRPHKPPKQIRRCRRRQVAGMQQTHHSAHGSLYSRGAVICTPLSVLANVAI